MIDELDALAGYSQTVVVLKLNQCIRSLNAMERQPTGTEHTQLAIAARAVVDALDDGHEEETIFERIGALRVALQQQASA